MVAQRHKQEILEEQTRQNQLAQKMYEHIQSSKQPGQLTHFEDMQDMDSQDLLNDEDIDKYLENEN